MVVSDLDGTLLRADRTFSATDLATLKALESHQILRAIATGRSLYSASTMIPPDFPIEYLIFSSGAGVAAWPDRALLMTHSLDAAQIEEAADLLLTHELDFMIHYPIPDNHRFVFHATAHENPDFQRRCQRYLPFAEPLDWSRPMLPAACQIVAIDPRPGEASQYAAVRDALPQLKVIRTTSPFDGVSTWIEIFPRTVSKGMAGDWVARRHGIFPASVLAVGNDYNDLDLLDWAGTGIVVGNAPPELQQRYRTVSSHNDNGFTEAVTAWSDFSPAISSP